MRILLFYLALIAAAAAAFRGGALAAAVTPDEALELRDEVREMFYHAYNGYMQHAFPLDELRPLTCQGEDTLGGYALTLIDSLDTLALMGDREQFAAAVEWIGTNVRFDINKTVSVFETTIRILGGLLSAHLIASDYATGMKIQSYDDQLLHLSEDLALRLLPAFDTPTGIPFGSVNLLYGVDESESKITSTAGGGTLTLEFGVLSRLTNNPIFEEVTKNAVRGVWARRSKINLVGAHINVFTGEWTQKDAGIGTSIDSFYEYLLKAYLLFGDEEYLFMFQEAYSAAMHYLHHDPWYVEVNMNSAATVWPLFNSLQAFWPGLQLVTLILLCGHMLPFLASGKNTALPLKDLILSLLVCRYLDVGRDMVASLQYGARCPCGYCHISDVESHQQEDHMESFFLAETVKYLWLLFDLAVGPNNIVENGPYKYIFSTEGHLLPASPEISLLNEHCAYFGAYCKGGELQKYGINDVLNQQDTNYTNFRSSWFHTIPPFKLQDSFSSSGFIKGSCPGLTHGQKFGISYGGHTEKDYGEPRDQPQRHSVVVVSNSNLDNSRDTEGTRNNNIQNKESETVGRFSGNDNAEAVDEEKDLR